MTLEMQVSHQGSLAKFQWTKAAVRWADQVGPLIRTAIKAEAPVAKTPGGGRLRDSIRYERKTTSGQVTLVFGSGAPYAIYVVKGTVPHIIRPRAARVLHWKTGGNSHFSRIVHHPGTKPNPFVRRAMEKTMPKVQRIFAETVKGSMMGKW